MIKKNAHLGLHIDFYAFLRKVIGHSIQYYFIIALSLGFIELDRILSETVL